MSLVEVTASQPTNKDLAEFYRLALVAGICDPPAVVHWADSILGAESSSDYAFIELSLSGARPVSTILSLLSEVPGRPNPELPTCMLFGHCYRLVRAGVRNAAGIILQLYRLSVLGSMPEHFANSLSQYEDMLSLARDKVYGSLPEVAEHSSNFLSGFEPYADFVPLSVT